MKFIAKLSLVGLALCTSVVLGASGGGGGAHKTANYENLEDSTLNSKLINLAHNIRMQKAGPQEASDMFKSVFPDSMEGSAKVKKLWFENGNTSLVVLESPIPMKIFFNNQFLLDNDLLKDKVGKVIKFKINNIELAEEPILKMLREPFTNSPYWIYANFSLAGQGNDSDFIDNIKPNTIPY